MGAAPAVAPRADALEPTGEEDLFQVPDLIFEGRPQYAVLDDGERFIFNEISVSEPRVVSVVRNWRSLLQER